MVPDSVKKSPPPQRQWTPSQKTIDLRAKRVEVYRIYTAGRNNKNIPRKERRMMKIPTAVKKEWDARVNESVHTDRNNWWRGILAELQALSKAKQEAKVSQLLAF